MEKKQKEKFEMSKFTQGFFKEDAAVVAKGLLGATISFQYGKKIKKYTNCLSMKTTHTNTYEWYLFIVINKKIGGERKMSWLEFIEWLRHMAGI